MSSSERRQAQRAWDALVKQKGGRERLHSISNILSEFSNTTRLDVFPNSYWDFGFYPVTETPGLRIWDGNRSVATYVGPRGVTSTDNKPLEDWIALDRIPFILESKWNRPEPQRVTTLQQGRKQVEVVETFFEGKRMDFIYEPEDMLVLEVRFYDDCLHWWMAYSFSDYVDIDGIKMPQKWGLKQGRNLEKQAFHIIPINFSFNVDYNPKIFQPPFKATTPDAWKRYEGPNPQGK